VRGPRFSDEETQRNGAGGPQKGPGGGGENAERRRAVNGMVEMKKEKELGKDEGLGLKTIKVGGPTGNQKR